MATDAMVLTRIAEEFGQIASQMMALIEGSQRPQTGITCDLTAREVHQNGLIAVEGEAQLGYTRCDVWNAPNWCAGFSENPAFMHLLGHPFFFCQENR